MSLRINTNVAALNAHNNMVKNDNALSDSLQKLSSGLRINKAADDASGMSIADSLKSQALGLGQAVKNANDGINMVQTADGALQESINIVNSIKTKSIQAAQDGQTTDSRTAIQSDISKLLEELDNIAKTTAFNGQKLLSGNFTNKQFQVGAYSGETVSVSIASSEASKVGHVTTGKLSLANNAPGNVEIALYSNLQNKNFELQGVNVAYDNTRDHSMAAVADGINKLSDILGITAQAQVSSTTTGAVQAGTLSKFSINGVAMNGINVAAGDADGTLVNAINLKTAQHGVLASVDSAGHFTLTSTDGRAIKVEGDSAGIQAVFGGQDLSTLGHVNLTQAGSSDITVTNRDGGDAVTLTNKLDINKSGTFTSASSAAVGSNLAANTILGAGWTTNQDMVGTSFSADIVTSQASTLTAGSVLTNGSTVAFDGTINGKVTLGAASTNTTAPSTAALYSTINTGSILGVGSTIGAGVDTAGTSVINATSATSADSTISSGSVLGAGTVIAANTTLTGTDVNVAQTADTVGSSTALSGSTLAAGTILGANTATAGNTGVTVEQPVPPPPTVPLAAAQCSMSARSSVMAPPLLPLKA